MARTAYFGRIYKKFNSTLQPDYSGWSEYDVIFKQGFDVDNPTIILSNYGADLESVLLTGHSSVVLDNILHSSCKRTLGDIWHYGRAGNL